MKLLKNILMLVITFAAANAMAQTEADANVESNAEVSGAASTSAQTEADADVETNAELSGEASTFDGLSAGNKTIARALMDAQVLPEGGSAEAWTLDQIAAAKSGTGWGQVFQQMQADGLITARNLGQVVSSYQRDTEYSSETDANAAAESGTLIDDGNIVSKSKAAGALHNTLDATGRAGNLHKQLPVTATHDITTAADMDISTGLGRSNTHRLGVGAGGDSSFHGGIGRIGGIGGMPAGGGVSTGGAVNVIHGTGKALGLGK